MYVSYIIGAITIIASLNLKFITFAFYQPIQNKSPVAIIMGLSILHKVGFQFLLRHYTKPA